MMKNIFLFSLLIYSSNLHAQVFETVINTNFNSGQWNRFGLIHSNDNGYILFGAEHYQGSEKSIIKIDSMGNVVWGKKYGYGFYAASPIGENHFAVYDVLWLTGWPDTIYMELVIYDSAGNSLSSTAIPESLEVSCMHPTSDGGTIAAGHHIGYAPPVLFKTDSVGNFELIKTIDSIPDLVLSDLIEANSGGYIGAGNYGYMDTTTHYRQMIIRLNNFGDTIWTKTYFTFGSWEDWKIYNSINNGFLVIGRGFGPQGPVPYIMQLDSSGNILWVKGIASSATPNMTIRDFEMASDSNFVFAGYTVDAFSRYPCLLKTDSSGNFLWMRKYPIAGYYEFNF